MKILSIIDSFKGSIESKDINDLVAKQINRSRLHSATSFPISDGGEGLLEAIAHNKEGDFISIQTIDLNHEETTVELYRSKNENKAYTYWLDSARVVGLDKVSQQGLTFETASSYPLGVLINKVLETIDSEDTIAIGLGGSGVVDGGLGLLQAMGATLYGSDHSLLNTKDNPLLNYRTVNFQNKAPLKQIHILSDVTNPYSGAQSGIVVYSKQKGANDSQIEIMNENAKQVLRDLDQEEKNVSATGAAGGIAGMLHFLGASIHHGFTYIAETLEIEKEILKHDIIITGEGYVDHQSSQGKLVHSIAKIAKKHDKKVIVIAGQFGDELGSLNDLIDASFSVQRQVVSLETAMTRQYLTKNIHDLIASILGIIDLSKE